MGKRNGHIAGLAGCLALAMLAGCDSHVPNFSGLPFRGPSVTVTVPAGMNGGAVAVWTVTWVSGRAPFTLSMNMGGGATPNILTQTDATSPFTHAFAMANPSLTDSATYTYTVTITDSQGYGRDWTGTYTVGPALNFSDGDPNGDGHSHDPEHNSPPWVEASIELSTRTITVEVGDWDDDDLRIIARGGETLTVEPATTTAWPPYPSELTFTVGAADPSLPADGDVTILVSDNVPEHGYTVATLSGIHLPGPGPETPDTLWVSASQTTAAVGEPVLVVVSTTATAYPFQYMNGVGVTVQGQATEEFRFIPEAGASYVPGSFDVGAPDDTPDAGDADPVDGLWPQLEPDGFYLATDDMINHATDVGGGRIRLDFNVTPLYAHQKSGISGVLFNFKLVFAKPGTYTLGLQEFGGVKRSYYSDENATEHYWGALMADEQGVLKAVVPGYNNQIVVQ